MFRIRNAFPDAFLHHCLEPLESIEWTIGAAAADDSLAFAWLWDAQGPRPVRLVGAIASLAVQEPVQKPPTPEAVQLRRALLKVLL